MHSLQPDQKVRIVTVEIAVPANISLNAVTEEIRNKLHHAWVDNPGLFLDWGFHPADISACPIMEMGHDPVEGEPFPPDRFCVIEGGPIDGFSVHGPFHTEDSAIMWAERNFRNEFWWTAELHQEPENKRPQKGQA